nr:ArmA_Rmt [uncultured bacterium]
MNNDLFEKLASNKKYSDVCPNTIRRAIDECDGRYKKAKDMEKAVREKLHGITSAFNDAYGEIYRAVADLEFGDEKGLESVLKKHVSTRERLPLASMDALYARIFEVTGRPKSILDLACGLNPVYLVFRWPDEEFPIVGVDVSRSCVSAIDEGSCDSYRGVWADLLDEDAIPSERFHIALLFKILPLLERQKSGAAMEVLQRINAEYIVVSFPTRTLGGRNVGMEKNYSEWMEAHLPENRTVAARFTTDNELYYILRSNRHA